MVLTHGIDASWYPLIFWITGVLCTAIVVKAIERTGNLVFVLDKRLMQIEHDLKVYHQTLQSLEVAAQSTEENTRHLIPSTF